MTFCLLTTVLRYAILYFNKKRGINKQQEDPTRFSILCAAPAPQPPSVPMSPPGGVCLFKNPNLGLDGAGGRAGSGGGGLSVSEATCPGTAVSLRRRGSARRRRRSPAPRISGFRQLGGARTYAEQLRPEPSRDRLDAKGPRGEAAGSAGRPGTEGFRDLLRARAAAAQLLPAKTLPQLLGQLFPRLAWVQGVPGCRVTLTPAPTNCSAVH